MLTRCCSMSRTGAATKPAAFCHAHKANRPRPVKSLSWHLTRYLRHPYTLVVPSRLRRWTKCRKQPTMCWIEASSTPRRLRSLSGRRSVQTHQCHQHWTDRKLACFGAPRQITEISPCRVDVPSPLQNAGHHGRSILRTHC